jgi:nucleotide-binding universal stress UspA family protein
VFEKIVVAQDHSEHSLRALATAAALAKLSGGELRLIHVREMSIGKAGPIPYTQDEDSEVLLGEAVSQLGSSGVNASSIVRSSPSGRVAATIVGEAEEFEASVIVIGSRGLTDLEGLVMGSTTHKVLHLAETPVLVVR